MLQPAPILASHMTHFVTNLLTLLCRYPWHSSHHDCERCALPRVYVAQGRSYRPADPRLTPSERLKSLASLTSIASV